MEKRFTPDNIEIVESAKKMRKDKADYLSDEIKWHIADMFANIEDYGHADAEHLPLPNGWKLDMEYNYPWIYTYFSHETWSKPIVKRIQDGDRSVIDVAVGYAYVAVNIDSPSAAKEFEYHLEKNPLKSW